MSARLSRVKCTDVLWVGAYESPAQAGINKEAWKWASDGSPVASWSWKTSQLILVPKGSPDQLVFANAAALTAGESAALVLTSHPGQGIGEKYALPKRADRWLYIKAVPVQELKSARVKYVE